MKSGETVITQGSADSSGLTTEQLGKTVSRYGLALVLAWIGAMKFTEYEAKGIEPLISHSPFFRWMLKSASVRTVSSGIGVVEIATALLIASRRISPRASAFGGLLAGGTFLTTLSFLLSTPGVWAEEAGGFPALSANVGQFLLKDLVLLGAALQSRGDALSKN